MTQSKYTPAPWVNQGEDSEGGIPFIQIETDFRGEKTMFIARVEANHETVGFKYELSDEDRANADLIAAAPDLLRAAEDAYFMLCTVERGSRFRVLSDHVRARLLNVISQATGVSCEEVQNDFEQRAS